MKKLKLLPRTKLCFVILLSSYNIIAIHKDSSSAIPTWKIEGLIGALNDSDRATRLEAIKYIAWSHRKLPFGKSYPPRFTWHESDSSTMVWKSENFRPQLVTSFLDDTSIHSSVLTILGYMGVKSERVVKLLIRELASEYFFNAWEARNALYLLAKEDTAIVATVTELLSSENVPTCLSAVAILLKCGKPAQDAFPHIVKLLHSENEQIQCGIIEALGDFGSSRGGYIPQLDSLVKKDNKQPPLWQQFNILYQSTGKNRSILDEIALLLKSKNTDVKITVIEFFSHIGRKVIPYLPQIEQLLDDNDSFVRSLTLQLLRNHHEEAKKKIKTISALLKDTSYSNQTMAASILVTMGPEGVNCVLNNFSELFKRTPRNTGLFMVETSISYVAVHYPDKIPRIIKLAEKSDPDVRMMVLDVIKKLGEPAVQYKDDIERFLSDENKNVRLRTLVTLGVLGRFKKDIVPIIAKYLYDKNEWVRIHAIMGLDSAGKNAEEFIPDLITLAGKKRTVIDTFRISSYENGYSEIAGVYHDRSKAIMALGDMGEVSGAYIPDIAEMLTDECSFIRGAAVRFLGKMGPQAKGHLKAVAALLSDDCIGVQLDVLRAFKDLGYIAKEYIPQIAVFLDDPKTKYAAIAALRAMGEPAKSYLSDYMNKRKDIFNLHGYLQFNKNVDMCDEIHSFSDFKSVIDTNHFIKMEYLQVAEAVWDDKKIDSRIMSEMINETSIGEWPFSLVACSKGETDFSLIAQILNTIYYQRNNPQKIKFTAHLTAGRNMQHHRFINNIGAPLEPWQIKSDADKIADINILFNGWLVSDSLELLWLKEEIQRKAYNINNLESLSHNVKVTLKGLSAAMKKSPEYIESSRFEFEEIAIVSIFLAIVLSILHFTFWVLLFILYPFIPIVRTIFFWNSTVRRFLGLGYIELLLLTVPFLRTLLVHPYKKDLISISDDFGSNYSEQFDCFQLLVSATGENAPIKSIIIKIKGKNILKGNNRSATTAILKYIGLKVLQPAAYIDLREIDSDIITAVSARLPEGKANYHFIDKLVRNGNISLLVDNYEIASQEAQNTFLTYFEKLKNGNMIVTINTEQNTLPGQWNKYELLSSP